MNSSFHIQEHNRRSTDRDGAAPDESLFHGPDGEPYFGWGVTADGSGLYFRDPDQEAFAQPECKLKVPPAAPFAPMTTTPIPLRNESAASVINERNG